MEVKNIDSDYIESLLNKLIDECHISVLIYINIL